MMMHGHTNFKFRQDSYLLLSWKTMFSFFFLMRHIPEDLYL